MRMIWTLAASEDGVFLELASHEDRLGDRGKVYCLDGADGRVTSEIEFLLKRGFRIVEDSDRMERATVYYEIHNHYSGKGALYAYAADLIDKLKAVPGPAVAQGRAAAQNTAPSYFQV